MNNLWRIGVRRECSATFSPARRRLFETLFGCGGAGCRVAGRHRGDAGAAGAAAVFGARPATARGPHPYSDVSGQRRPRIRRRHGIRRRLCRPDGGVLPRVRNAAGHPRAKADFSSPCRPRPTRRLLRFAFRSPNFHGEVANLRLIPVRQGDRSDPREPRAYTPLDRVQPRLRKPKWRH